MKRHWNHDLIDTTPDNRITSLGYINGCAICRTDLNGVCKDCSNTIDEVYDRDRIRRRPQELLYTLILCFKPIFDIRIIKHIYSFTLLQEVETVSNGCMQIELSCEYNLRHAYHQHCFEKWSRKRNVCPLCNSNDPQVFDFRESGSILKHYKFKQYQRLL
jgi:hypothetical protein